MLKFLEQFVYWWSSYARASDIDAVCSLETVVIGHQLNEENEPFVLAEKNGDLISVIEIRGARRYIGYQDGERMVHAFAEALVKRMRSGSGRQHSFAMGFRSDPDSAGALIGQMLEAQRQTAKVLGIENQRMLDERHQTLAEMCTDESIYLVMRTHAHDLAPHEKKIQRDERAKLYRQMRKDQGAMNKWNAQIVAHPIGSIMPRHEAAVMALMDDLS
ncbi:MAG: hypothetical protein P3W87_008630, partial [Gammaproteobacteria bacterium]|nr:hypothetical protein [Gammaproteobacteria bacterium]